MNDLRQSIKQHFESNPRALQILNLEYMFVFGGVALAIIGMLMQTFFTYGIAGTFGSLFSTIGIWGLIVGVIIAFIRRDDNIITVSLFVMAGVYLIKFIINLVNVIDYLAYGVSFPISPLINAVLFGLAGFIFARFAAPRPNYGMYGQQPYRRPMGQQAPGFGRTAAPNVQPGMGGFAASANRCVNCGVSLDVGDAFCTSCGTKQPMNQASAPMPSQSSQAPAPAPTSAAAPVETPAPAAAPAVEQAPAPEPETAPAAEPMATEAPAPAPETVVEPTAAEAADDSAAVPVEPQVAEQPAVPETAETSETAPVSEQQPQTSDAIFCSSCGSKNELTSNFCESCGSKLQ